MSDEKSIMSRLLRHRYKLKELMNLKPNLLCVKCKEVALEPQICHPCEHLCCLECLSEDKICNCGTLVDETREDHFTNGFIQLFIKLYDEIGIERPLKYRTKPLSSSVDTEVIPNSQPPETLLNNRSRGSNTSRTSRHSKSGKGQLNENNPDTVITNIEDTKKKRNKRLSSNVNANTSTTDKQPAVEHIPDKIPDTSKASNSSGKPKNISSTAKKDPKAIDSSTGDTNKIVVKQKRRKANVIKKKLETRSSKKATVLPAKGELLVAPEAAVSLISNSPGPSNINKTDITNTSFGSTIPKNLKKKNIKGETALHVACIKGNINLIRTLLDAGAEANTKDNAGWTPLHEAVLNQHEEVVLLLLEHGTLVDVPAEDNITPLHEAVILENVEIVKMLVKFGADINRRNSRNETPLSLAVNEEIKEALKVCNDTVEDISLTPTQSYILFYADDLDTNMITLLKQLSIEHSTKLRRIFNITQKLTHVIVKCEPNYVCKLSAPVMLALVIGQWIISENWVHLSIESKLLVDVHVFEVKGTISNPNSNAAKRSRNNAQNQLPGLFNGCHIYFHGPTDDINMDNDVVISITFLSKLVRLGGGEILKRAPDPERIPEKEKTVPFHAHIGSRLAECSHYIIYRPDYAEPPMKYNMRHIKTLPVQWLLECIENFKLVEPIGDFHNTPQAFIQS